MQPGHFNLDLFSVVNTLPSGNDSIRLRLGSVVPLSLKSYEGPFNWRHLHPGYPLSPAELSHGVLILEEKFHDEYRENYGDQSPLLSTKNCFAGISLIAKKITQAHFYIELQRYAQANDCMNEIEHFIKRWSENNTNPEYAQGFLYILEGLEMYLEIQISKASPSAPGSRGAGLGRDIRRRAGGGGARNPHSLEGLKHFKRLPAKAKYIIWTVRDVFLIHCSRTNVDRVDWMEAILLEMEPYIPKWHFYLYRAIHGTRKLVRRPLPLLLLDDDEQEEVNGEGNSDASCKLIGGAHAAGVVDDDPLSISYQCLCLAQMFTERQCRASCNGRLWTRTNSNDNGEGGGGGSGKNNDGFNDAGGAFGENSSLNQYYPWRFGQYTFEMPDEVLECILEKTVQVLEMDCHLDGVYLNLSEIHMFILPPVNRNMELAFRCLKKALRLNNKNPRTHYRIGLAHLKLTNHKQAVDHFREAIRNPNNIGAIFGLLQLLMAHPVENTAEIQSIFKFTMKNLDLIRVWDKRCLRTLHYLKGCFYFMLQENKDIAGEDCLNEAITSWIIAHDNESPKWSYYFLNLSHQSTQFQWPTKKLNLTNVSNALKHAAYLERTQFRQLLLDICSEVDDAIRRSSDRNSSTNASANFSS